MYYILPMIMHVNFVFLFCASVKQDDDDIVLQIAETFRTLLLNPKTSDQIMKSGALT